MCARSSHCARASATRSSTPRSRSHSACVHSSSSESPARLAVWTRYSTRDVGGDVLLARIDERRRAALVAAVRAQPTVLAPLGELRRGRRVVDDDEHAAPEDERARLEPLAYAGRHGQAAADRAPPTRRRDRLRPRDRRTRARGPLRRCRRRRRPAPPTSRRRCAPRRGTGGCRAARWRRRRRSGGWRGDRATKWRPGPSPVATRRVGVGAFVQRAERVLDRLERQHVALLGAAGVGALHQHVAQRRRAPRLRGEHVGGQAPAARARLDHEERIAARRDRPSSGPTPARPGRRRAGRSRGW